MARVHVPATAGSPIHQAKIIVEAYILCYNEYAFSLRGWDRWGLLNSHKTALTKNMHNDDLLKMQNWSFQ